MVVKSCVDVVDLAFDTQENLLVLCVLLRVPPVEPGQPPHERPTNNGDENRNPPVHDLHPTLPDTLGFNAGVSRLLLLLALAFGNRGAMKLLFALGKTQAYGSHMALETDSTSTWKHVEGEQSVAFVTVD